MGIKNIWSLNVDELLVSDQIKYHFNKKDFEVCFPLNAQMKDVDLVLLNLRTNKTKTIQVKGSRTYEPKKAEVNRYGLGGAAWFKMKKSKIFKSSNKVDYFIFVLHSFVDGKIKREIKIEHLVMPRKDFFKYCEKKKARKGGFYNFIIWSDPKGKRIFDIREDRYKPIKLECFLNKWELLTKA